MRFHHLMIFFIRFNYYIRTNKTPQLCTAEVFYLLCFILLLYRDPVTALID